MKKDLKYIDFHAHVFPEALAKRGLDFLMSESEQVFSPVTDMTIQSLTERMDEWGIRMSVVQPVVTKATQIKSTNEWASSISSDRIISFGGIYPNSPDWKSDIDFVYSLGLRGIKLHPEYQDFTVDDPKMMKIFDYALSKEFVLIFHSGYDPAFPPPFKSNPKAFANLSKEMKGGTIIAAHMGGHAMWDDVEKYLCGTSVYLDTSMGFEYYSAEQFMRIVSSHGSGKILFGSDSPWSHAGNEIDSINSLPLSNADKDNILFANAERIISILPRWS